jgi:hypothetical protein
MDDASLDRQVDLTVAEAAYFEQGNGEFLPTPRTESCKRGRVFSTSIGFRTRATAAVVESAKLMINVGKSP